MLVKNTNMGEGQAGAAGCHVMRAVVGGEEGSGGEELRTISPSKWVYSSVQSFKKVSTKRCRNYILPIEKTI